MNIFLNGNSIEFYPINICANCSVAENYATTELIHYIKQATGKTLGVSIQDFDKSGAIKFVLGNKSELTEDGFKIFFKNGDLIFEYGDGRGCIYAVYTFLEKVVGYRFFAQSLVFRGLERGTWLKGVEKLKNNDDIFIDDNLCIKEIPVFFFRDGASHAVTYEEWCTKQKLNGEMWERKRMDDYLGGSDSIRFTGKGGGGHTFNKLVPVAEYGKIKPEYFAEIDGKRITTGSAWNDFPQLCMTNEDLIPLIVGKLKGYFDLKPQAGMVSVSQNDNNLFCECVKCRKSYEKLGRFGTLINFVNKIAVLLEKNYPKKLIQTFAYTGTNDISGSVKAHKNILVQYCPTRMCRCHALDDPNCPINSKVYKKLNALGKVADNIFIYDYRSCLKYSMFLFPDIHTLRDTMRVYAENNVKGIYSELCIHTSMQPTFEELKAYLFSKLAWNPYMDKAEFEQHMDEFLEGFYGEGWRNLREFIDKWSEFGHDKHLTSFLAPMINDNIEFVKDKNGDITFAQIVPKNELAEFCEWAYKKFDAALKTADEIQKPRVEIARTSLIWYELFHTMDDIIKNGSEEEKNDVIARNKDLCSRMRKYCMKYTTYSGMDSTTKMFEDFSLPPSKWKYKGNLPEDELQRI